ncbi:MAG: hypothetical protein ACE5GQ_05085 [Nitrospinales bacterium]
MAKLELIESLVQRTPCPVCLHTEYQVNLNCSLPNKECDHVAVCQNCHY